MQGHKLGCSRLQGRVNCRESSSKSWSIPQWVAMILVIYGDIRCLSLYLAELYIYIYITLYYIILLWHAMHNIICPSWIQLKDHSWITIFTSWIRICHRPEITSFWDDSPLQQHHHFSDVAATAQLDFHDLWRLMFSHLTPAVTQFIHHQHVNFI